LARNVTQKIAAEHLVSGRPVPGKTVGITIDQTLTQDATGVLAMLEEERSAARRRRSADS